MSVTYSLFTWARLTGLVRLLGLIERISMTSRHHGSTICGWQQNQRLRRRKKNGKKVIGFYWQNNKFACGLKLFETGESVAWPLFINHYFLEYLRIWTEKYGNGVSASTRPVILHCFLCTLCKQQDHLRCLFSTTMFDHLWGDNAVWWMHTVLYRRWLRHVGLHFVHRELYTSLHRGRM